MQNNELETIAAAMQDALHRAYALGRSDALRRVVEMVQSDELGSKTVALLSHSEPLAVEAPHVEEAPHAQIESSAPPSEIPDDDAAHRDGAHGDGAHGDGFMRGDKAQSDNAETAQPVPEHAKTPASMKGFLLDYLYPLGAKK